MANQPDPVAPSDQPPFTDEDYMSPRQRDYFRHKLLKWREALLDEAQETLEQLRDHSHRDVGDEIDRASREASQTLELRTRDRYRKLVIKIDEALARIDAGDYGYCEETGEPIGLARLEARPIATLSVEAQERRELRERQANLNR
ncbi:RNA polymerase-binding protein DksA [Halochromatium sp.]